MPQALAGKLPMITIPDHVSGLNTNQANNGETHLDDNLLRSSIEYRSFARKNMATNVQDVIILLGDSITKGGWAQGGFAQLLAERYIRKLDVLNRDFTGYQTDRAIPACERVFAKQYERLYVPKVKPPKIWYGANDVAPDPGPHHAPRQNQRIKATLFEWRNRRPHPRPEYPHPPESAKAYAEAIKEVGEKENVPVADIWTSIFDGAGRSEEGCSEYMSDGLHLNSHGYNIAFQAIIDIAEHLERIECTESKTVSGETEFTSMAIADVKLSHTFAYLIEAFPD
ncbi:SGNH hydrolase [Rhizopogon vinicolor AM-OR11-026]|uniref:SGNH hydrolase n=1 Tax=Rhizopogon vinicolor AM-OR11-026 TaxID=1314800 RepID=A0A1B7MSJ1_9AGAM|nr:SGNH hydrolase [Rhizopogon vinicolor AM-OR11-026]